MGVGTRLLSASRDGILLLTLHSEDGLSRLERCVLVQIAAQIGRLSTEREFSGCVITGTERAFAVGANIEELVRLTPTEAYEFSREGQRVCRAIERSRLPVIAMIRGYCMGGGLDLALACHARVAAPDAVFAHPGGSLGILTGWGGTQRLTRLIGRARAIEMLATGHKIHAKEALDFGLISCISPSEGLFPCARTLTAKAR
jgi:enoyl-CoA hydratase/carnithine racemase